ncbi:hypothetical protein ACIRBX_18175 [Kitasatospora sp. NPDC096147]|uniref:hypothetical protein n=1 Tax=Kitasatospora sp. NPDC096147 TaxID=3364093 RepID=UPI0037FD8D61
MPSLLRYEILTDPTSLQASSDGRPSVGTVYVIVSNTHQEDVEWRYIDLAIPVGSGPDDLTDDRAAIRPSITTTYNTPWDTADPVLAWDEDAQAFRAQHPTRPGSKQIFPGQQSLTLKLENVPVTAGGGLVRLTVGERTGGGDGAAAMPTDVFVTTLALVKQVPRVPRNFRPKLSLLPEGAQVELEWDGPGNLDYWIRFPDGQTVPVALGAPAGRPVTDQSYLWPTPGAAPIPVPKRGTTYTLIAGTSLNGQPQHGYFLTTTVHALVPEFASGTRTPWIEGGAGLGRAVFTPDGVLVDGRDAGPGTVTARTVDVHEVRAEKVKGHGDGAGWIRFPDSGVEVLHGPGEDRGVVTAERIDVDGVDTRWVGDRTAGHGWTSFPDSGINVHRDGGQELGVLSGDRVDVNGVDTRWVGDRTAGHGWVDFPAAGVNVRKDGGQEWGVLAADKADLNGVNTKWVQGRDAADGWIEFPRSGINVRRDGGQDWGTVSAGVADLNELKTGTARVKGELTVGGGMKLSQDGERLFTTLPDRILFHGINEFKRWVTFEQGIGASTGKSGLSLTKEYGVLIRGCDVQIQQGELSVSTGEPPRVRTL